MKTHKLGLGVVFVSVLAVLASFVFSAAQTSAVTEEARTLQKLAPYKTWGKANVQPIVVSAKQMAVGG